jgi:tRNA-dihydrouridine synthase A
MKEYSPWRMSVAPMMDWTDRHCRTFHRLLTQRTRLYTEMVTTGALIHGDVERHLRFNDEEHPVALQLGGSEPADLAQCAKLGEQWGYDEINLNCGCPSERVQRGSFGACLMNEPQLVRDCVKAMVDTVSVPVTVKHRIGIDKTESYEFVRDFVGTVAEGGCHVFIVHARNAWLKGLSPKENREVPPLRYEMVHQLKRDFPQLTIVLNGGVTTTAQVHEQLKHVDGVMVGREAYHHPWWMSEWDSEFFALTSIKLEGALTPSPLAGEDMLAPSPLAGEGRGEGAVRESQTTSVAPHPNPSPQPSPARGEGVNQLRRESIEQALIPYLQKEVNNGLHLHTMTRQLMGLWNGEPGGRKWRQVLSDNKLRHLSVSEVFELATEARSRALI